MLLQLLGFNKALVLSQMVLMIVQYSTYISIPYILNEMVVWIYNDQREFQTIAKYICFVLLIVLVKFVVYLIHGIISVSLRSKMMLIFYSICYNKICYVRKEWQGEVKFERILTTLTIDFNNFYMFLFFGYFLILTPFLSIFYQIQVYQIIGPYALIFVGNFILFIIVGIFLIAIQKKYQKKKLAIVDTRNKLLN